MEWKKICEQIEKDSALCKVSEDDNPDGLDVELVYITYLRRVKGLTKFECYDEWKKVIGKPIEDDKDKEFATLKVFQELFAKTNGPKYQIAEFKTPKKASQGKAQEKEIEVVEKKPEIEDTKEEQKEEIAAAVVDAVVSVAKKAVENKNRCAICNAEIENGKKFCAKHEKTAKIIANYKRGRR